MHEVIRHNILRAVYARFVLSVKLICWGAEVPTDNASEIVT